ncbi:ABC transporter ATP-binding protein [Gemmiger formicilis]|uniref:ABC transporter ATP-binding protein n=1 Tax=Gemmiger formicilis TaxID=745368 RepID=UPI0019576707|nr:ABC transporter ATP-binding protein [Gemmiger formicilis]MBM6717953.1 ABC transporter ATP-binding protein [Gemmiger formicilis]
MAKPFNGRRPQNLRRTLQQFGRYLGRHKVLLVLVGVLAAMSAAANLLGTYMIKPIVNQITTTGSLSGLVAGVAVAAAIYAIGALSSFGYTQIMVNAAQKVLSDIRRDLFDHLQTLPLPFFDAQRKGNLMSLFTNDVDTLSDALNNSFAMLIQSFVQVVGTLTLLFVLSWQLSLLVLVGYAGMFLYIRYSTRRSQAYFSQQQASLGELDAYIEEMVTGQKVVKVFNHEQANLDGFIRRNEKLREAGTGAQTYAGTMVPAVVSIGYLNYAVITVVGGVLVMLGHTDLGSLASYLVFVRQSSMPINQLTQQSNLLLAAMAGAERIFDTMDQKPEIDEGTVELVDLRPQGGTGWAWRDSAKPDAPLVPLRGDVRFEDVSFGYEPGQTILEDLNLYAKPGQKIAFVGSTGAGKTTITNLINRFYEVNKGRITYDGIDVRRIRKDDLRHSLGMVLQDTHLFTGTVADNIRFGKLDATQAEIEQAAKIANADSFIRRLPQGYDTMITGDGANLSQGQRQLLAIARAAVADPPVLILDEATSSIDTHTEALIEKGMDRLMEGRTVFVIAHRLSTVRNANAIMVLEHGRIVERGDHEELLALHGEYYQLYNGMFELS